MRCSLGQDAAGRPQRASRAVKTVKNCQRVSACPSHALSFLPYRSSFVPMGSLIRRLGGGSLGAANSRKGFAEAPPHYHGHRQRLRERLGGAGAEALPDYELLELVLYGALTRVDTKPLAKALLATFGSFTEVIAAPPQRLAEVDGVGDSVIATLKVV